MRLSPAPRAWFTNLNTILGADAPGVILSSVSRTSRIGLNWDPRRSVLQVELSNSGFTLYYSRTMFCPSCGTESTIELKYCNRCGANLSTTVAPQNVQPVIVNVTKPTIIIGALLLIVTLGGFGGLVGGAIRLAEILHGNDSFMAIILFGMLTIMIVDIFLIRLLSRLINAALSSNPQPQFTTTMPTGMPAQIQNPTTSRLQGVPSVTENTTRLFEPYRAPEETPVPIPVEKIKR